MTPNDNLRKTLAIVGLAEMTRHTISETAIRMYVQAADQVPADAFEAAILQWSKRNKFFPAPAEIIELCGMGETSHADRAVLAFSAFEQAVVDVGGYKSPDFDDQTINATVRNLGGWSRACEMPCSEFDKFYRPQFLKTYEVLSRTGIGEEAGNRLVGEFERSNSVLGYERPQDVIPVATGLPWAGERKRLTKTNTVDRPRIELRRP